MTGIWVNAPHRRRRALALLTAAVVLMVASMSLIRTDHSYLWAGLALLAFTAACNDLATVPYNAMLSQLSTPATSGRISGAGLAVGYGGSVACCCWSTRGSWPVTVACWGCPPMTVRM